MQNRLSFLLWFARNDMFRSGQSRFITRLVVINIALLIAFSLGLFGSIKGHWTIQNKRLAKESDLLSVYFGHPFDVKYSSEEIKTIEDKLLAKMEFPKRVVGCFPFDEVRFPFFTKPGKDGKEFSRDSSRGRTFKAGDPLFDSLDLRPGGRKLHADEGLVVSPELLRDLEFDKEHPPKKLRLKTPDNRVVEVEIIGVTENPLPEKHRFIIPEAYHLKLLTENPDPKINEFATGFLPRNWPPDLLGKLPDSVIQALNTYDLDGPFEQYQGDDTYWRFRSKTGELVLVSD